MSKSNRMYKIFMTTMIVIIAGLLLATGIIAIQKQMKMKVSFSATPSIFCQIDVKANGADDSTYTTIFNNNGEAIIGTGIELSGNSLLFSDTFASAYATTLGTSFVLKITNLMTENGLKVTASGTGATSNPTYVTMKKSGSGAESATMTISGNSALSTLQLSFVEYHFYSVSVVSTTDNYEFEGASDVAQNTEYTATIKAKAGYNLSITVTRDDGTERELFAGIDNDYVWNSSTGALTIYASAVTGDITINCLNNDAISYTISYDLAGGSATNPTAYTVETESFTLTNPTKTGYTFAGWTGSNGTTAQTSVTIAKGSTGARSYTATWTIIEYTISYNLDGGSVATANPTTYTVETNAFTLTNPTKTGCNFAGWTGSNGSTAQTSVTIAKGSTGNKSYTANWVKLYTITLNLNGGSYNGSTSNITLSGVYSNLSSATSVVDDYVVSKLSYTDASGNTGYTFGGWYSDVVDATSVPTTQVKYYSCNYFIDNSVSLAEDLTLTGPTTLHARWLPFTINTYASGHVWEGYKYITFENHATQEAAYSNYPARWIVIGAGESVNSAVFNGVTRPNGVDTTTEASELGNNEILLLSEQTLISDAFDDDNGNGAYDSGYDISNWSDDGCTLRNWLNDTTTDTTHVAYNRKGFLTTTGLLTYISYIQEKTIYTAWQGNRIADSATAESTDKVFLLATNTGYNNQVGSGTNYENAYGSQSFIMEKYLGSYTHNDASSNPKIFSFSGKSSYYWWLRSGGYSYNYFACSVYGSGYVGNHRVDYSDGVRPSFVLNLA